MKLLFLCPCQSLPSPSLSFDWGSWTLQDGKNIKLVEWHRGGNDPMGQRISDSFTWLTDNPAAAQDLARNASFMIHSVLTPDVGPRYAYRPHVSVLCERQGKARYPRIVLAAWGKTSGPCHSGMSGSITHNLLGIIALVNLTQRIL